MALDLILVAIGLVVAGFYAHVLVRSNRGRRVTNMIRPRPVAVLYFLSLSFTIL